MVIRVIHSMELIPTMKKPDRNRWITCFKYDCSSSNCIVGIAGGCFPATIPQPAIQEDHDRNEDSCPIRTERIFLHRADRSLASPTCSELGSHQAMESRSL